MSLYLDHFGLREPPFRITPHTDFFFDGAERGATLEALLYATLHEEGIVKVVGEVGSGKTMLCRVLMERLPAHVETVYLANPSYSRDEILVAVAEELKVAFDRGRVTGVLSALQERLIDSHGAGRRTVILIDEAHAMPEETLEQVRLLSNLETSRHKLLQIVLFGQPELDEVLALSTMRQLKDRITHAFRMRPLSQAEVATYLTFRMRAAGYRGPDVFSAQAAARIARASAGLTRRVNILADKALLAAFSEGRHAVGAREARRAVADSEFAPRWRGRPSPFGALLAAGAAGVVLGGGTYWLLSGPPAPAVPAPAAVIAAPAARVAKPPPTPEPPPRLDREEIRRLAAYDAGRNALLSARLEATRDKLASVPDERFSLELYISDNSDAARVERFLQRARGLVPLENLYIVPVPSGDRYRIWALYGDYADRAAAAEAGRRLPPKYQKEFALVPRTFGEIRRPL
jgi:type II secretory pathway predicted ATPase ExeA